jgi:hypothetical protein
MLAELPPLMRGNFELGAVDDAYLAAVAVSLSARLALPAPPWTRDPERILPYPWFANPGRHMRALLLESAKAGRGHQPSTKSPTTPSATESVLRGSLKAPPPFANETSSFRRTHFQSRNANPFTTERKKFSLR